MKKLLSLISVSMLAVMLMNTVAFAGPVDFYFYLSGGSLTNDTTDANDTGDGIDDVNWQETNGDYVFIGSLSQFDTVVVNISNAADAGTVGSATLTMKYPTGTSSDVTTGSEPDTDWSDLTFNASNINNFASTGNQEFGFTIPGDWAQVDVDGGNSAYYVAMNCSDGCASTFGSTLDIEQLQASTLSGGGGAVPEFSTYMFIAVLMVGAYLITRKPQVSGASAA